MTSSQTSSPKFTTRDYILPPPLLVFALVVGVLMAALIQHPGYTDAYYYYNAGERLATGNGLTDAAVWTYIGLPDNIRALPVPSHLYWMPLTSIVATLGIRIVSGFDGAQIPFVLLYVVLVNTGYAVALKLSQRRFMAWSAAILVMVGGFYAPYLLTTDNFTLYGVVAGLCLLCAGFGRDQSAFESKSRGAVGWFAAAGILAGLAHLTRADGLLLIAVVMIVAIFPIRRDQRWQFSPNVILSAALPLLGYLFVMTPWMIRTLSITGSLLPTGGFQTAWMTSYEQIANYPGTISLIDALANGLQAVITPRIDALSSNLQTLIAVEGMIVLAPFMLIECWARRRQRFLHAFLLYAVALHVVMTFVFPLPGYRGGLFHSSMALFPFWMALGLLGLERALIWVAKRRRWKPASAIRFFFQALIIYALALSILVFLPRARGWNEGGSFYDNLGIRRDSTVLINDPSALYYWRKQPGVVLPNAPPETLPTVAERFGALYIVVDINAPTPLRDLWERQGRLPNYLKQVYSNDQFRVYEFQGILDNEGGRAPN